MKLCQVQRTKCRAQATIAWKQEGHDPRHHVAGKRMVDDQAHAALTFGVALCRACSACCRPSPDAADSTSCSSPMLWPSAARSTARYATYSSNNTKQHKLKASDIAGEGVLVTTLNVFRAQAQQRPTNCTCCNESITAQAGEPRRSAQHGQWINTQKLAVWRGRTFESARAASLCSARARSWSKSMTGSAWRLDGLTWSEV